jgi:Ran GTPase-activating protein (RanGAP) involved in mRNA processing and transport
LVAGRQMRLDRAVIRLKAGDSTLRDLCLADDPAQITPSDATSLAEAVGQSTQLTSIDLSSKDGCGDGAGFVALCNGLKTSHSLMTLRVGKSMVSSPAGAQALALVLQKSTSLARLNLQNCGIGDQAMTELSKGLSRCAQLAELDVSGNHATAPGASALSAALRASMSLKHFTCSRSGLHLPLEGLAHCASLTHLDLSHNQLPQGLGAALALMPCLHRLLLSECAGLCEGLCQGAGSRCPCACVSAACGKCAHASADALYTARP